MIIVLLADGFEEIEALTPVDMLRRAGLDVKTVGVSGKIPIGTHGIPVVADISPDEVKLDEVSLAIFPGGMPGAVNLDASPFTDKVIEAVKKNGGRLAAICAAPLILGRRGLLDGKEAICYPGFEKELRGAKICKSATVVTSGSITTARDMTASLDFANELVKLATPKDCDEQSDDFSEVFELFEDVEEDEVIVYEEANTLLTEASDSAIENKYDYADYESPSLELLTKSECEKSAISTEEIEKNGKIIIDTLNSFGVSAVIRAIDCGPRITRYELVPAMGVKVNKIVNLFDDIQLSLAIEGVRMEAPIPGKAAIGIEVPHRVTEPLRLRDMLELDEFKDSTSKMLACIGKDVTGNPVFADITKMPHALIAGATGTGKSVCINSILTSILYKARPDEVKFILIDPKRVEFNAYEGIPHLMVPIVVDPKQAAGALMWAVEEMERRYSAISALQVRNIDKYNEKVTENPQLGTAMPKIVIVIDELNDLMLQVRDPIEDLIMSLTQKSRAAGIHLIIATQRPSVNVITGVIKANIPTRIALKVTSYVDSKTILDCSGAEKLLNNGDMLFSPVGAIKPIRVQGAFVSDREIMAVTEALRQGTTGVFYDNKVIDGISKATEKATKQGSATESDEEEGCGYLSDKQFLDAVELAVTSGKISTSLLQRKLSIGYGKAAKYIDIMEALGIVTEPNGQKPRDVLITMEEWQRKLSDTDID